MNTLKDYLEECQRLVAGVSLDSVQAFVGQLERARAEGRRVFVFGNGGSGSTAAHFACDLGKGTVSPDRPRIKVFCLNDNVPTLTAYANDFGFETVFAEPLISLAERGDIAVAMSGSGNSPNIVRAMQAAGKLGLVTIGFSGRDGGKLKDLVEVHINVPGRLMPHTEDVHLVIAHAVCEALKIRHE